MHSIRKQVLLSILTASTFWTSYFSVGIWFYTEEKKNTVSTCSSPSSSSLTLLFMQWIRCCEVQENSDTDSKTTCAQLLLSYCALRDVHVIFMYLSKILFKKEFHWSSTTSQFDLYLVHVQILVAWIFAKNFLLSIW